MRRTTFAALVAVLAAALVTAGCASSDAGNGSTGQPGRGGLSVPSGQPDELTGTLRVFAAASLTAGFDELRDGFATAHPALDFPPITYAGSSTLATQIGDGAPADVFASANEETMDRVSDLITGRRDFATNTLQIAVAPGNPKHITSLADLAKPGVTTVICAAPVPCGAASQAALEAAGVTLTPASEEQNVKAVLAKVTTGTADAGLVYRTDVASAGSTVDGVDFPAAVTAVNTYPIAAIRSSDNPSAARSFIDYVLGPHGQEVLSAIGFGQP